MAPPPHPMLAAAALGASCYSCCHHPSLLEPEPEPQGRGMRRACTGALCKGRADPSARPHQCVDVEQAQRTEGVRVRGFLSPADIATIHAAAAALRGSAGKKMGSIQPEGHFAWNTIFLQSGSGFAERLSWLREKLLALATRVQAEQRWGVFAGLTPSELGLRVMEYHEYTAGGKLLDPEHCDHGSLVTIDVMLGPTADFVGGELCLAPGSAAGGSGESDGGLGDMRPQLFEQGDALVFVSHKRHAVLPITRGRRCVLVTEFWHGESRRCPCRCETNWGICECRSQLEIGSADRGEILWEQMSAVMDVDALEAAAAAIGDDDEDDDDE